MTYIYDWNSMPHEVAVVCPQCRREAVFEASVWVGIPLKKDVPFFKKSPLFEYVHCPQPMGHSHFAGYYPRLHGRGVEPIQELPEGYSPQDWAPPQYHKRYRGSRLGTISCACGLLRKHDLDWPKDAFYQVDVRGRTLWAYDRSYAKDLLEYIESKDRNRHQFRNGFSLYVVPTHFQTAKVRDEVSKKLGKLLQNT